MHNQTITERIRQLRRGLLVHRFLYYVLDSPILSDYRYTELENELVDLCKRNPEVSTQVEFHKYCPSHTVGSSNRTDYPLEIIRIAEWLHKEKERGTNE